MAIVLFNEDNRLFWAKRIGMDAWQFPQGGVRHDETVEDAMYRELYEEVGLLPEHVEVVGVSRSWLRYKTAQEVHKAPLDAALHRPETALVPA